MAIYVDRLQPAKWRWKVSCHLLSDSSLDELHAFAAKIGCHREWFQDSSTPHYDLTASRRASALKHGAKMANRFTVMCIINYWRKRRRIGATDGTELA